MKPGHGIADASWLLKAAIASRRLVLSALIAISTFSLFVASPAAAREDCALTTTAAPLVFTALNQTMNLVAASCDQRIENNTYGGLFTSNLGDAYNYFGLGVSPHNGQLLAQQFSTSNATYEFTGDLSTSAYSIKLISVVPNGAQADTITLYTCETPPNTANANGCPTTRATMIAVSLDVGKPEIITDTLPAARSGTAYSATLAVTSTLPIAKFTIQVGALPPGLTISNTGVISGTPTTSGTFDFTVRVANTADLMGDKALSITVATPTLTLTPETLAEVEAGASVTQDLTTSGGLAPYSYQIIDGAIPDGITLSANSLTGRPKTVGTFNFTVRVTDSTGGTSATASRAYSWTIANPTLTVSPTDLPTATVGVPFSQTLTISGGNAPYHYVNASGRVPPGLTFKIADRMGGTIVMSGTPTTSGSFDFTVSVRDATGGGFLSTFKDYSLDVVDPPLTLNPASLPAATVGVPFSQTLTTSGGNAPYTYGITAGALPTGLTFSATGSLTGTPTSPGTFNFTVTVTDSTGGTPTTWSRAYSWTIATSTLTLNPTSLPAATAGVPFSQTLTTSGGNAPYSYSVTAGALPIGLVLSPNGILSGTPTASGTFSFTVTATDTTPNPGPYSASQTYHLTIDAAAPAQIPTMMEWAMLLLALLIAGCGALILNRRSAVR